MSTDHGHPITTLVQPGFDSQETPQIFDCISVCQMRHVYGVIVDHVVVLCVSFSSSSLLFHLGLQSSGLHI